MASSVSDASPLASPVNSNGVIVPVFMQPTQPFIHPIRGSVTIYRLPSLASDKTGIKSSHPALKIPYQLLGGPWQDLHMVYVSLIQTSGVREGLVVWLTRNTLLHDIEVTFIDNKAAFEAILHPLLGNRSLLPAMAQPRHESTLEKMLVAAAANTGRQENGEALKIIAWLSQYCVEVITLVQSPEALDCISFDGVPINETPYWLPKGQESLRTFLELS